MGELFKTEFWHQKYSQNPRQYPERNKEVPPDNGPL